MLRLLWGICCVLVCQNEYGQMQRRTFVQHELGFFAGGSYYLGDLNPLAHFKGSCPAGGAYYRMAISHRYALRTAFSYGTLFADDALSTEPFQNERNLRFDAPLYELALTGDFNFVDYRIGHKTDRFSFFIFSGIAGYYFQPQAVINNQRVALNELKTEGQASAYSNKGFSIPFGIGIKFNFGQRAGIALEWGLRKTFNDYLDDVSTVYKPTGIVGIPQNRTGSMRGNPNNTDWYSFYGVNLCFKLPSRRGPCYSNGSGYWKKIKHIKFSSPSIF
jgi:hypothetical protein